VLKSSTKFVTGTECYSETTVTENTEGTLYYPGFDQYGSNVHCEWIFNAPDDYVYNHCPLFLLLGSFSLAYKYVPLRIFDL